jgi:hypothetical protein
MAYNTAEGGTNGTTVTAANSGGLSGVPFDTPVISATCTLTFDNTHPAHGALSYKFQLGGTAGECYMPWTTGFTPVNVPAATFRIKGCYFTANPGATIYLYRVANIAGTNTFGLALDTAGKLLIKDGGGTIVATMATAIPLSTLFDLEVTAEVVGTTGTIKVRRYDVADSGDPTDQLSGTVTAAVPMGRIRWGHTGTGVATVGPWWYDDLEAVLPDGVVVAPDTFLDNDLILPEDAGTSPLGSMYQPWPLQVLDAGAAGLQATVNQATETETAQPVGRAKALAFGQPSTTDTAQPITPRHTRIIGQALETDTAQSVSRRKARTLGQAVETDTAQPSSRQKRKTIGQAAETDTAQPVSHRKARTLGQVTETDTGQPIARRKTKTLGQPAETDTGQPITRQGTLAAPVGKVTETNTAQPFTRIHARTLGQAAELDTARTLSRLKLLTIGRASETDTAQPVATPGGVPVDITVIGHLGPRRWAATLGPRRFLTDTELARWTGATGVRTKTGDLPPRRWEAELEEVT